MNELTKVETDVVMPAMNGDEALKVWAQYQDLIQKVCTDEDYQQIKEKKFRKKSGWRKIATFFNLSVSTMNEKREDFPTGDFAYHFTCRATAPNGRYADGTGSCNAYEKAKYKDGKFATYNKFNRTWDEAEANSLHNVRGTAETRAWNRAVSNLVGGGEVSADEIVDTDFEEEPAKPVKAEPVKSKTQPHDALGHTYCSACGATVSDAVEKYSLEKFNKVLCMNCQQKVK